MKEKFCEKYFQNKVEPKYLSEFKTKTPQGNLIEGYISRKSNRYLGSIVITHICEKNGKSYDTEQFVQSFPKIHYWDDNHKLNDVGNEIIYYCQEKLDGTCLIIYSLNDDKGNSIEIIPKSRNLAVAGDHILEMFNLVDKKAILEFFKNPGHFNDTLMFELYGILNRHEIAHMENYIDIRLIGAYIDENFLNCIDILCNSELDNFNIPDTIFTIEKNPNVNGFSVNWYENNSALKNYRLYSNNQFATLYGAIQEVKLLLKQINDEYIKFNNRRVIEGVVINGEDLNNNQLYLKIKPADIEAEAKMPDSVPRRFILKEIHKYFDEFGHQVREIYQKDENHHVNYVKYQLREEFSYEQIEDPRTIRRIRKVFMEVWDSKIPPISLQNICDNLVRENPDLTISELIKLFAQKYPSKKKQSRLVFNILSSIKKRS